jgi:hypothetical protein
LSVAVRHEQAHRARRDNLKRLLVCLAPGMLPFYRGCGSIERGWLKFAEWAADDCAVDGNPRRSVALAAALVAVARLGVSRPTLPLATCLVDDAADFTARVDRLVGPTVPAASKEQRQGGWLVVASSVALLGGAATQPAVWRLAHEAIEFLAH